MSMRRCSCELAKRYCEHKKLSWSVLHTPAQAGSIHYRHSAMKQQSCILIGKLDLCKRELHFRDNITRGTLPAIKPKNNTLCKKCAAMPKTSEQRTAN